MLEIWSTSVGAWMCCTFFEPGLCTNVLEYSETSKLCSTIYPKSMQWRITVVFSKASLQNILHNYSE